MLDSKETSSRLEGRLARVLRKIERAQSVSLTQPMTLEMLPSRNPANSWEDKNPIKVKLPKLDLPIFDGNILCWQEFWDIFSTSVHEQNIPNVTKFSYLKNSLRAAAATAISGISVTNDNYEMVIGMLKDKFGKTEDIIAALYSRLQHLPQAMNQFNDIKSTYEAMEKILKQLEVQRETVDQQRKLVQQMLSKFPIEV